MTALLDRRSIPAVLVALGLLGGCTDRTLELPSDLAGPALASADLATADLASVDLGAPDLAVIDPFDFATVPPDLGHAPWPDFDGGAGPERLVYAHSDTLLYALDPDSLAVTTIGAFGWPDGPDHMTDIALDQHGNMIGISYSSLYVVDPVTAQCAFLAPLVMSDFNGLTFVAGNDDQQETLLASANDGAVYTIDPTTGAQTFLGFYGHELSSSGDMVSVAGASYATVIGEGSETDLLVSFDPKSGAATVLGDTGVEEIWGLGYWKQTLYGFTASSGIVTIDTTTGKATTIPGTDAISFWGAGVITAAPTE